MSSNYLSSISIGVGSVTTLYGAYSYYSAKGNKAASAKQRENAKRIMAVGIGILALGAAAYLYSAKPPELPKVLPQITSPQPQIADGNGRECRSLMNIVLQWGGIKGVGVPYDDPYTAAIKADQKTPGTFVKYLIDLIKWNNDQKVLNRLS